MTRIEWTDAARDQLADIWVTASVGDRDVIEAVVLAVERDLILNPYRVGESRFDWIRFEARGPLGFWFEVTPHGDRVRIFRVRRPPRRR